MQIGLIIIGNEILKGQTRDQHVEFLAKILKLHRYQLSEVIMIADNSEIIEQTLLAQFKKWDVVITSGGVGPTLDDLTPQALKKVFPQNLQEVKNNFGAAPGFVYFTETPPKLLMSLPGVPREFQGMVTTELIPKLNHLKSDRPAKKEIAIRTSGIKEETIFGELCPTLWSELEQFSKSISSLPRLTGVDIIVEIPDDNKLEQAFYTFIKSTPLSKYIWHIGNAPVEEIIIQTCLTHGYTLALAESCTGGLISHLLTNIPNASQVLKGSIISYTNEVKELWLDIPSDVLASKGAVSSEVAKIMADNALKKFKTDFAVSVTGLAGPASVSDNCPVGTLFVGIAKKACETETFTFNFVNKNKTPPERESLKQRFAVNALIALLKRMRV